MNRVTPIFTKEDLDLADKIIIYSQREAVKQYGFLEKAIYLLKPAPTDEINTIGADYEKLYYNPLWLIKIYEEKKDVIVSTIAHCVMHCLLLHPSYRPADTKLYGTAADACVLKLADAEDIIEIINLMRGFKCFTTMDIYRKSVSDMYVAGKFSTEVSKLKNDDHSIWYTKPKALAGDESGRESSNIRKSKSGERIFASDRSVDELEGCWQNLFSEIMDSTYGNKEGLFYEKFGRPSRFSKCSFLEYVRRFVSAELSKEDPETFDMLLYTAGMDMYEDMPIIEWNETSEKPTPTDIIIAIDMSGSCAGDTAENFLRQLYTLFTEMDMAEIFNIHVVLFDCVIQKTFILRSRSDVDSFLKEYSFCGMGGTSFIDVFSYADNFSKNNNGRKLRGMFFFSDTYGCFPKEKGSYPTTFFVPVSSNSRPGSYGHVPDWVELVQYDDN